MPFIGKAQGLETEGENHHCFFHPNSIVGGIAMPYSQEFQAIGINTRLYYNITENFCLGPEFSFIKAGPDELKEVNFVAHYIFETRLIGIYPLAGVNYSHENKLEEATATDWGIVFGAGVHRNVKKFNFFTEFSINESNLKDRFVTLGLLYMF